MRFTSERLLDDGVAEREFTLGDIPGFLWTPGPESTDTAAASAPTASASTVSTPLILISPPPLGLGTVYPRIAGRARYYATRYGFASATLELPGSGGRPGWEGAQETRAELRRVLRAGEPVGAELVDALVLPLVERAAPEWRAALDALLALPGVDGPVGYEGGVISLGVRLAAVEPRIRAAGLFAGSFVPAASFEEARRVTVPLHVLLQWDDEDNDRQAALDLFDAFGSQEKTLHANMGGHTGVPAFELESGARFFARHLRDVRE
ncbi:alpha/beta hydrolase [Streptomyces sp. NPDC053541]|uniref:alpha/beta hydrolase n=1 Tax=Streptomyces sp. NPDC053541 TaxID=3365709 RepID=UPI0037D622DF